MNVIFDQGGFDLILEVPTTHPYIYADGVTSAEPRDPAWLNAWLDSLASAAQVEIIGTPSP